MAQSESNFHSHLSSTSAQQPPLNFNLSTCRGGLKFAWSVVGLVAHENGLNFSFFLGGEGHTITIFMFTVIFAITETSGNYETILGTITMVLIDSKLNGDMLSFQLPRGAQRRHNGRATTAPASFSPSHELSIINQRVININININRKRNFNCTTEDGLVIPNGLSQSPYSCSLP